MYGVVLATVLINAVVCDDLLAVVVIYRHGDRTPIQPYPTDPYRNASYWPVGFGQLTNLGKMQHYLLGKWLRDRYASFLSPHYSEKDFYLRSTDADRTLMSAEANLAGLYPPHADQIWDPAIPWQPIPIHTMPELEDNLLSMKKNCPKYNLLITQLFKTPYFVNISHKNHDLYAYLTKNSGTLIASLESLEYLYNTMFIETLYNLTLPDWARVVYPSKLKPWADLSFATPCWTQDLARLKTGPLFHEIVEHFTNATKNVTGFLKFRAYSAHDITIANVLNTMGAFQVHGPPYASTIMLELRRGAGEYVNIFYKNSSIVQNITAKGCDFNCKFDDFVSLLRPIVISRDEWNLECQLEWYYYYHLDDLQYVIYASAGLSFVVFTLSIWMVWRCCKRMPKGGVTAYTQLPSDEVA
ncbi:prostatic acid phosphatase-like isoform X2 [Zophobas morio]|uniref:prostatic acid phosphatase-like isoform X2 n=1 Tax=Zophobas morio TaxID=2755281 RepID=UPI0030835C29